METEAVEDEKGRHGFFLFLIFFYDYFVLQNCKGYKNRLTDEIIHSNLIKFVWIDHFNLIKFICINYWIIELLDLKI